MESTPALLEQLAQQLYAHSAEPAYHESPSVERARLHWASAPAKGRVSYLELTGLIWRLMATSGYEVVPMKNLREEIAQIEILNHLDTLAHAAHTGWLNDRVARGWTYASGLEDVGAKTSPRLRAWSELQQHERDAVRALVRSWRDALRSCRLKLVRSRLLNSRPADIAADSPTAEIPPATLVDSPEGRTVAALLEPPPPREFLEQLAPRIHEAYVKHRIEHGESVVDNPSLRPWERLDPLLQYSNRNAALQLWRILESGGLGIATPGDGMIPLSRAEFELHIEPMAKLSHLSWVNERSAKGWKHATGAKDVKAKTHPSLLPWEQLAESEREKDRQQIRDIPEFLHATGYTIVRRPGLWARVDPQDFTPLPED